MKDIQNILNDLTDVDAIQSFIQLSKKYFPEHLQSVEKDISMNYRKLFFDYLSCFNYGYTGKQKSEWDGDFIQKITSWNIAFPDFKHSIFDNLISFGDTFHKVRYSSILHLFFKHDNFIKDILDKEPIDNIIQKLDIIFGVSSLKSDLSPYTSILTFMIEYIQPDILAHYIQQNNAYHLISSSKILTALESFLDAEDIWKAYTNIANKNTRTSLLSKKQRMLLSSEQQTECEEYQTWKDMASASSLSEINEKSKKLTDRTGLKFKNFYGESLFHILISTYPSYFNKMVDNPDKLNHIFSLKNNEGQTPIDYFIQNISRADTDKLKCVSPELWNHINHFIGENTVDFVMNKDQIEFYQNETILIQNLNSIKINIDINFNRVGSYKNLEALFEEKKQIINKIDSEYIALLLFHKTIALYKKSSVEHACDYFEKAILIFSRNNSFFNESVFHSTVSRINDAFIKDVKNINFEELMGTYTKYTQQEKEILLNALFEISDVYLQRNELKTSLIGQTVSPKKERF